MDNLEILRNALRADRPPESTSCKPPEPGREAAIWRFLKAWSGSGQLGCDEAVLFRQAIRWGLDGVNIPVANRGLIDLLERASVTVDASGIVSATPFCPKWIEHDVLPTDGIDSVPIYRQDPVRVPAEHYLRTLRKDSSTSNSECFQQWKSIAQKEGAWLTATANPGSTNLVVLPTGMGKSLCFQLLPVFSGGLTVVVVPTVALAIDQCRQAQVAFKELHDVNPVYFAANDPDFDPASVVDSINQGRTRIVFTSPEACVSGRLNHCLNNAARSGQLENLVVDEAHIVSSWGMYFRVDFQLLAGLQKKWLSETQGKLRTFLFTATITPAQKIEVLELFSRPGSEKNEFLFHSLRPELTYFDRCFQYEGEQRQALSDCLWHLPRPMIVYSTEVSVAKEVYEEVRAIGFTRVGCFTGNTRENERRHLLEQWRNDDLDVMIATSAFGLGVDKQDVRSVVHCCLPEDLNRYYQEVGRGGRDGFTAISVLIPTEGDISVAKGMKPKLLGTNLVQKRWRTMWEAREEINIDRHEWKIPFSSKRPGLLGDRTYQENIKWNKRLVLQLVRAQQLEVTDLQFDSERSKELGEVQEFATVRLKDGFNPDSPLVGASIGEQRKEEAEACGVGFERLLEHLKANRCISLILKRMYGSETHRCCGGCRWCRNEDRRPNEAPVYEYESQRETETLQIFDGCPHPLRRNSRPFRKEVRKLHESGIRRFACHSEVHEDLLEVFSRAIGVQELYRLDAIESGCEFSLLEPEKVVVIHLETPTRSLTHIGNASCVIHILCGDLSFNDIRYLLPKGAANPVFNSGLGSLS